MTTDTEDKTLASDMEVHDSNGKPCSRSLSSILSSLSYEMEINNISEDDKDTSISPLPDPDSHVSTDADGLNNNNSIDDYACAITSTDQVERSISGEEDSSTQTVLDAGDTHSFIPYVLDENPTSFSNDNEHYTRPTTEIILNKLDNTLEHMNPSCVKSNALFSISTFSESVSDINNGNMCLSNQNIHDSNDTPSTQIVLSSGYTYSIYIDDNGNEFSDAYNTAELNLRNVCSLEHSALCRRGTGFSNQSTFGYNDRKSCGVYISDYVKHTCSSEKEHNFTSSGPEKISDLGCI